jgi:hypothetical protein
MKKDKIYAWGLIIFLTLTLSSLLIVQAQSTRPVNLTWDPYNQATDGDWLGIRIYEVNGTSYTLAATTNCQPGPPISCPNTISFSANKNSHYFVARSFDSSLESDNSNTVFVSGAPQPPKNVSRQ